MNQDKRLEELQHELERQNAELAAAMEQLAQLGHVELDVPAYVLREIEDACTPCVLATAPTNNMPVFGLRA